MNTVDIILIIILGVGALKGYGQGFIVELFSFLGFFVGLFIALELTIPVSLRFFGENPHFEVIAIVVFVLLFILLLIAIKAGAKALKKVVDITVFGTLDNIAGAIAGLLKWAFIISVLFWVLKSVGFDFENMYAGNSFIFPYIVDIGPNVFGWLSEILPFIRDLIDKMEEAPNRPNKFMTLIID